jgi:hypothetical protein
MRASNVLAACLTGLLACAVGEPAPEPDAPSSPSKEVPPVERDAPAAQAPTCLPCLSAGSVEWRAAAGPDGAPRSALLGCRTYQRSLDPTDALRPPCEHPLPACDARRGITIAQVEHALGHPDVEVALASAPRAFGRVPRAADGRSFRLTIDGRTIDVGDDCAEPQGSATCAPVPRGVREAVTLLSAVDAQETAACP